MGANVAAGSRAGRRVAGYTFVEMFVTIAIIAIVTSFAVPNIGAFLKRMQLKSTADMVKRQLLLARMKALADPYKHCGVYLKVAPADSQLTRMFLDVGTDNNKYDAGDAPYLKVEEVPKSITMSFVTAPTDSVFIFRGDGSAKYSGAVSFTDGKDTVFISVLASTGRIRVN